MADVTNAIRGLYTAANATNLLTNAANANIANGTGVTMAEVAGNSAAMSPNSVAATNLYNMANGLTTGFGGGHSGGGFGGGGNNFPVTEGEGGAGDPPGVYYRSSSATAKPAYTAATLPSATSQEAYINALYDANEQKKRAALEAEYTANVGTLDQQAAKIPAQYDTAANQAAAQAAVNRANFNEQAAAAGLNTGAAGQAALAQNNALLGAVSEIRRNQADALNDVEAQRVALQKQYQAAIADAIANNEADRAAALYNEAKRVDESLVSTAVNQATENYRAWQSMYG